MISKKDVEDLVNNRPGLRETLDLFLNGFNIVLIAPTGYGKTVLSLVLFEEARSEMISSGLIHVAPYRALVREIYRKKFKPFIDESGWQMHGELSYEDKTPYYMRDLVVTTLDSFIYNLYRIPVAEMRKILEGKTLGHYYPVLSSIFTSTVVFDEAHSYLDETLAEEKESIKALYAAIEYLTHVEVPIVVETATMGSNLILRIANLLKKKGREVKIVYVGSSQIPMLKQKLREEALTSIDDDSFKKENSFEWRTEIIEEPLLMELAKKRCSEEPLLIIRNTIKRAVETYLKLKEPCSDAVLLHSLLSINDRYEAIEKANNLLQNRKGVIVSTQIVEAGVEIGGSTLITDPAPLENLAQRAGRLCRDTYGYKELCRERGAEVYIVKTGESLPYSEEDVNNSLKIINEELKSSRQIEWRLLDDKDGYVSFASLIEKTSSSRIEAKRLVEYDSIMRDYLATDASPEKLLSLMRDYDLKLIDRGYLLTILIPKNEDTWRELVNRGLQLSSFEIINEYFEVVTVDAERLFRHESRVLKQRSVMNARDVGSVEDTCLQYVDSKPLLIIVHYDRESVFLRVNPSREELRTITKNVKTDALDKLLTPGDKGSDTRRGPADTFLLAKPECYEKSVGLRIWG